MSRRHASDLVSVALKRYRDTTTDQLFDALEHEYEAGHPAPWDVVFVALNRLNDEISELRDVIELLRAQPNDAKRLGLDALETVLALYERVIDLEREVKAKGDAQCVSST